MKMRISLTIEDYFDYVGTSNRVHYSLKERVKTSLPFYFENGYNLKFKVLKLKKWGWHKWYRVHISVNITQEQLDWVIRNNETNGNKFYNLSVKQINSTFKK